MNLTIANTAQGVWTFSWDAESGVSYEVWLDGVLLATVDEGEYVCSYPGYTTSPPPLEIVEEGLAESETYPPHLLLQWRRVPNATAYKVEESVSGTWTQRRIIMDLGEEYFKHQTGPLEDGSTALWRVSALDNQGDAGTAVGFSVLICRNPPEPDVAMDYGSGGLLTISEA